MTSMSELGFAAARFRSKLCLPHFTSTEPYRVMYTATRLLSRSSGLASLASSAAFAPAAATSRRVLPSSSTRRAAFSVTASRPFRPAHQLSAVSPVAGKPASEDVKDMAKNAVEEGQGAPAQEGGVIPLS